MIFEDEYDALAMRIARVATLADEAQEAGECDLEQRAQSKIQQLLENIDCLVDLWLGSGYQCPLCQPNLLNGNLRPLHQLHLRNCGQHSLPLLLLHGHWLLSRSATNEDGQSSSATKEPTSEIPASTENFAPNSDFWNLGWNTWQRHHRARDAQIAQAKREKVQSRIAASRTHSPNSGPK